MSGMPMSLNASSGAESSELLLDVPSQLQALARLVVRGFYPLEEALIVDMLVKYPCLREEDLASLLKFDTKMLRAKIAGLRNDKFLQTKQRIETEPEEEEGKPPKVVKMNCYFINYKIFVNIVKYKLDHMRKKMETSERDATNRSSFRCTGCNKTYTDLEVDMLLDPMTMELRCSYCSQPVEEDESAGPQNDTRQLLAKFNEQMEKLYDLLRTVENIRLAPSVLEPEPVDLSSRNKTGPARARAPADGVGKWSGEGSRHAGFKEEEQTVNITFGDENSQQAEAPREVPIWMDHSTVSKGTNPSEAAMAAAAASSTVMIEDDTSNLEAEPDNMLTGDDEITSLLLRHEKRDSQKQPFIPGAKVSYSDSEKSDESDVEEPSFAKELNLMANIEEVDAMSEDEEEGNVPTVLVGGKEYEVTEIAPDLIQRMSAEEKERYTQIYQDYYSNLYD